MGLYKTSNFSIFTLIDASDLKFGTSDEVQYLQNYDVTL